MGWRLNLNCTPSSFALATSRLEPGMLASSRRYTQVTLAADWRMEVRLQSMAVSPPPRTTTLRPSMLM